MINKRSLWFLTLFSLILVLSVYYVTMPSELLMTVDNNEEETEVVSTTEENTESAELVSLRVEAEEQMLDQITELKEILTSSASTTEEKNQAFEKMQDLNRNKGNEESLEKKIQKEFNLKSFVKIDGNNIQVVVDSKELDKTTANKIMRCVQGEFDTAMSISIKYQG